MIDKATLIDLAQKWNAGARASEWIAALDETLPFEQIIEQIPVFHFQWLTEETYLHLPEPEQIGYTDEGDRINRKLADKSEPFIQEYHETHNDLIRRYHNRILTNAELEAMWDEFSLIQKRRWAAGDALERECIIAFIPTLKTSLELILANGII